MAKPIFISLIPNFLSEDIRRSLRLLFLWKNYKNGAWEQELEKKLSSYLGIPGVILMDSGRAAQYFLLKALGIGAGDEVIIQAFTCVAVPNSIRWAHAMPIYADIDSTLNIDPESIEARITPRTKAVIIQHTFGYPADVEQIAALCKKHKLLLIEDCAHGFGGSYAGRKLGTLGDAAFFSFGRDKVISGIWGGAIATRDESVIEKIRKEASNLPIRSFSWIALQLMYAPLTALIIATYGFFGMGKFLHLVLRKIGVLSSVLTAEEKAGAIPARFYRGIAPPLACIISAQLDRLDAFIAHRRLIAQHYAKSFHMPYVNEHTYLRFTMMSVFATELRKSGARKNIFLGDWYDAVVAPDTVDKQKTGYSAGSCPRAEQAAEHALNLPTHPRMTLEGAAQVTDFVKTKIRAWTSRK